MYTCLYTTHIFPICFSNVLLNWVDVAGEDACWQSLTKTFELEKMEKEVQESILSVGFSGTPKDMGSLGPTPQASHSPPTPNPESRKIWQWEWEAYHKGVPCPWRCLESPLIFFFTQKRAGIRDVNMAFS